MRHPFTFLYIPSGFFLRPLCYHYNIHSHHHVYEAFTVPWQHPFTLLTQPLHRPLLHPPPSRPLPPPPPPSPTNQRSPLQFLPLTFLTIFLKRWQAILPSHHLTVCLFSPSIMATITFLSTLHHHPTHEPPLLWPAGVCFWVKVGQMRSPDVGGQPNNSCPW